MCSLNSSTFYLIQALSSRYVFKLKIAKPIFKFLNLNKFNFLKMSVGTLQKSPSRHIENVRRHISARQIEKCPACKCPQVGTTLPVKSRRIVGKIKTCACFFLSRTGIFNVPSRNVPTDIFNMPTGIFNVPSRNVPTDIFNVPNDFFSTYRRTFFKN